MPPKAKKAPSKSANNSQPKMVKTRRSRTRRPGKNVSSTGIRLVDTELLATVSVPKAGTTALFASVFSPRLVGTVMPSMAAVFETFKIHSVRYRYVAAASGFVAGQVYMGVSYDPTAENDDYDAAKISSLKEHWTGRISSSSSWITVDPKIVRADLVRHLDRSTVDLDSPFVLRFFGNLEAGKTATGAYPLGTIEVAYDITFAGFKPPAKSTQPQNNLAAAQSKATIASYEATVSCKLSDSEDPVFSYKVETVRPVVFQKFEGKTGAISSIPVRVANAPVTSTVADNQGGVPANIGLIVDRVNNDITVSIDDSYDGKPRYVVLRAQGLAFDTVSSEQGIIDPTKVEVTTTTGTVFSDSTYSIDANGDVGDGDTGAITSVQFYSEGAGLTKIKYADQQTKAGYLWVFSIQMVVVQLPSVELTFTAPDKLAAEQQQPKQKEVVRSDIALSDILARLTILESRENNYPESLASSTDFQFV